MVKSQDEALDAIFGALADTTRRDVLAALDTGAFSLTEFAQSRGMSLTGLIKHVQVLERAGLVERAKQGRVVRCELTAAPLQEAAMWMSRYERFWSEQLDALDRYLYHQQEVTPCPSPPPPRPPSASAAATTPRRTKSGAPGPKRRR